MLLCNTITTVGWTVPLSLVSRALPMTVAPSARLLGQARFLHRGPGGSAAVIPDRPDPDR